MWDKNVVSKSRVIYFHKRPKYVPLPYLYPKSRDIGFDYMILPALRELASRSVVLADDSFNINIEDSSNANTGKLSHDHRG